MDNKIEVGASKSCRFKWGTYVVIWTKCPTCGKERWLRKSALKHQSKHPGYCLKCVIALRGHSSNWKGGRLMGGGKGNPYVMLWIPEKDFFYSMAANKSHAGGGYVSEHRLVMAKYLGRCLHSWEIVHHRGVKYPKGSKENRRDNRMENLQLTSDIGHKQLTFLEARINKLEAENWALRTKLQEVTTS